MSTQATRRLLLVPESSKLTTLCAVTGQPDFAPIPFTYIPGPSTVELKQHARRYAQNSSHRI